MAGSELLLQKVEAVLDALAVHCSSSTLGQLCSSVAVSARLCNAELSGAAMKSSTGPVTVEVLQALQQLLPLSELLAGRLVCKQWAALLGSQVAAARLPAHMWQHGPHETGLRSLLRAFPCLRSVHLTTDTSRPFELAALAVAVELLVAECGSLSCMHVQGVSYATDWEVLLAALQPLAHRLRKLALAAVALPPHDGMAALAGLTRLTSLCISCPHVSRLQAGHVAVIAGLSGLQELQLSFRAAEGTLHAPLALVSLGNLRRLTSLHVEYTGLRELARDVALHDTTLLQLTRLVTLSIALVSPECLRALPLLPALRSLSLRQLDALDAQHCGLLARCRQLTRLHVEPMAWDQVARLGALTGLRGLSLEIGGLAGRGLAGAAGAQLLGLTGLVHLQSLELEGRLRLNQAQVAELAAAWPGLTRLQLCSELQDGNRGFGAFSGLRHLRLQPFKWDAWSSEAPTILWPTHLPQSLTCLEAIDVWCLDSSTDSSAGDAAGSSSSSSSADDGRCVALALPRLQRLVLRSVSPIERDLLLPDLSQLTQLRSLELAHSQLSHEHIAHIVSHLSSLTSLKLASVGDARCIRNGALAQLTRLGQLWELQLSVYERALDRSVRGALASMRQLRALSLATCSRDPVQMAKSLQCLSQLTALTLLRVGVGYGALEALKKLGACVTAAVPGCHFEIETDV